MFSFIKRYLMGGITTKEKFFREMKTERRHMMAMADDTSADRFLGIYSGTGKFDAPMRLKAQTVHYFTDEPYLRKQDRADWQRTDRRIQEFAARLVLALRAKQIPFYVNCAYRTPEEQRALRAKGFSKVPPERAAHCRGAAVDIVHAQYHWDLTKEEWAWIGILGKEVAARMGIDIRWGGDWDRDGVNVLDDDDESFWDPAHWELYGYKHDIPYSPTVRDPVRKTPKAIASEGWCYIKGYTGKRK